MFAENTFLLLFSDFIFDNGTFVTMTSSIKCAALCVNTIGCVSYFYSNNLESCLVSFTRYQGTTRLTPQMGYHYFRIPSVIGQACTTKADCPFKKSRCHDNKCDCNVGFSYDASQTGCVKRCAVYGDMYSKLKDLAVKRCNVKTFFDSPESCMQMCTDEKSFVCKNIDYYVHDKKCYLCDVAWHDLPRFGRQYHQFGWVVYHRHCAP